MAALDTISLPHDLSTLTLRLLLATALGAAVGVNRELQRKPAGLRTHALVSLGAALASLVGLFVGVMPGGDPAGLSRVMQGVVAGIGFIGGGVIMHRDDPKGVHGLATASSIWVVAAVGMAAGCGLWRAATISVALALLVLIVGGPIDRALHRIDADPNLP